MKSKISVTLLSVAALLTVSCACSSTRLGSDDKNSVEGIQDPQYIYVCDSTKIDSLESLLNNCRNELSICRDSLTQAKDSVVYYRDTIEYDNYINARRIEKIKYYISICESRSTNKKYFYGWIKRAVSE